MKTYMREVSLTNKIFALLLAFCIVASGFLFWDVQTRAEDGIPAYSGIASVALNKNAPLFTDEEITTSSFEKYGELDKLGRCTAAVACIGNDLMPTEERQSIGDVRPTGWKQNKYSGLIDTDPPFLYNRSEYFFEYN